MRRLAYGLVGGLMLAGAAVAQTPDAASKHPNLFLELRGAETVLLQESRREGESLCGTIRRKDGSRNAGCIAIRDVTSVQLAGTKAAVIGGVRGGLCVALAPVCFGVMARKAEAHAKERVEKANAPK